MEKLFKKTLNILPVFFKIFDEILVNAADNLQRDNHQYKQSYIKVDLGNEITIKNDGFPIPIEIYQEQQIYVLELIFGVFLTYSNLMILKKEQLEEEMDMVQKSTNVYSQEFRLEVCDGKNQFKLVWKNKKSNKQILIINNQKKILLLVFLIIQVKKIWNERNRK